MLLFGYPGIGSSEKEQDSVGVLVQRDSLGGLKEDKMKCWSLDLLLTRVTIIQAWDYLGVQPSAERAPQSPSQ